MRNWMRFSFVWVRSIYHSELLNTPPFMSYTPRSNLTPRCYCKIISLNIQIYRIHPWFWKVWDDTRNLNCIIENFKNSTFYTVNVKIFGVLYRKFQNFPVQNPMKISENFIISGSYKKFIMHQNKFVFCQKFYNFR